MTKKPVSPGENLAKPATTKKTTTKRVKRAAPSAPDTSSIDHDARRNLVAAEAYYLAERRGFTAGHELEDWVAAERAIDLVLTGNPAE